MIFVFTKLVGLISSNSVKPTKMFAKFNLPQLPDVSLGSFDNMPYGKLKRMAAFLDPGMEYQKRPNFRHVLWDSVNNNKIAEKTLFNVLKWTFWLSLITAIAVPSVKLATKYFAVMTFRALAIRSRVNFLVMSALIVTTAIGLYSNVFLILFLHGMAALSRVHYRFIRYSIGVELSIFMIALTGLSHGPKVAATVGALHFLISVLVTKEPKNIIPVCLLGYISVGVATAFIPFTNILTFGMSLVLVYNLVTIPLFLFLLRYSIISQAIFLATHLAFNYYIFSNFGKWGLKLIGL